MNRDITARKSAQAALLESEAELRAMFDVASIGIAQADPRTGRFLRVNRKLCAITGFTAKELLGLRVRDITHPDEREDDVGLFERVVRGEAPDYRMEKRYIRKDRSVVWVNVNMTVVRDEGGRPIRTVATIEDITERKKAAEELSKSKQVIEGILDAIPVRVFWKDKNLVYLGCNAIFARDAGFVDPKDVIGKDDYQMGWRDQAELYRADDFQVIGSGRPKILKEEPQTTPDGKTITLLTSKSPLRDSNGDVSGVLGTYMDITELKRAEEALRDREEIYRTIVNQAAESMTLIDPKTLHFAEFNDAAYQDLGYTRDEFGALTVPEIDGVLTPEEIVGLIARVLATGQGEFTATQRCKNGALREVHVSNRVVNARGREYIAAIWYDITERKKAEEALRESESRYRSLFEQSPLGIYQTTPDGKILAANVALLGMLGYASLEELSARNLEVDGYEPGYPRQAFKERMEREGEVMAFESSWLRKDGTVLGVRESARAVRDRNGKTLYYEGTIEDVTEQRRLEEERRRLVAAVEQASETIVITDTGGPHRVRQPGIRAHHRLSRAEEAVGGRIRRC